MRPSLFCYVTKRWQVVSYRRLRTTYRSQNISNYRSTLREHMFSRYSDVTPCTFEARYQTTQRHVPANRSLHRYSGELQMTSTHHQSAPAHLHDYFRQASRQMHSLLSLAHVDRMTSIYMEGTYLFVLLSQAATRSLNTQRTSFPQQATRFLPLWRSQHKTPCLQVSSPQLYIPT
jgi:hypothetical protein